MEEDRFWKRKTGETSRAKEMKLRDLGQEKERPQQPQPKPSTYYANAASN